MAVPTTKLQEMRMVADGSEYHTGWNAALDWYLGVNKNLPRLSKEGFITGWNECIECIKIMERRGK